MAQKKPTDQAQEKDPWVNVEKIKPDLRRKVPPLIDLKISNPLVYIKNWWKRILGNEGLEIRIRLKPLTTIAITIIIITISFGIGRFVFPFKIPFFEYTTEPAPSPTPTPLDFRETGFTGELKYNSDLKKYYLITSGSEAVNLTVPENVDLSSLVGRRIFAVGKYYFSERNLMVDSVEDLEVLPKKVEPIPTTLPSPSPSFAPSPASGADNGTISAFPEQA